MDKERVWSAGRSLPRHPRRTGTSNTIGVRTPPPGLIGEWNSSGPLDNSRSLSLQTLSSAGETPVKLRRISSAPEMHRGRKNAAGYRERVQEAVGTIASCILAGSCIQAGDRNPELASLIVSGHVDVLSAKVCTLSLDLLLEGDGSSSESGTVVMGDYEMLVTAVRNLIENAIVYSNPASQVGIGLKGNGFIVVLQCLLQAFEVLKGTAAVV
jgi:hypothetical protein